MTIIDFVVEAVTTFWRDVIKMDTTPKLFFSAWCGWVLCDDILRHGPLYGIAWFSFVMGIIVPLAVHAIKHLK